VILDPTSREILRIRVAYGLHHPDRCPTCRCSRTAPVRQRNSEGRIIGGCVDAAHTSFLTDPADAAWHAQPEAYEHRRRDLEGLTIQGAA